MKTLLITVVIVVVLIAGVKYFSTNSNSGGDNAKSGSALEVSEGKLVIENNNIELGDIPITGGKVETRFSFKNEGSEPVTIKKGETSCMCTEAVVEKSDGSKSQRLTMNMGGVSVGKVNMTIEPGETATLVGIFDPMAHGPSGVGSINRDITLETNSKTNPEMRFSFSGNVIR
ncbi:MAG: DUF1573 domain-containing protein [bacterium]|nr:DUF1573 domain-containing protein [bacterium]